MLGWEQADRHRKGAIMCRENLGPGNDLDHPRALNRLSDDERRQLLEWQVRARVIRVDAVEDLTSRPWSHPISGCVIGLFQSGSEAARWLVVGQDGAWAVAYCVEGKVSGTLCSLSEALALIYPGGSAPADRA